MSLIINKVKSSSVQISYQYLESEFLFGYLVSATYTVDFADISFSDGTSAMIGGIEALRLAYQQQNLTARIGGDEFVNGRFLSQSFEESFLSGRSNCTITIEESKKLGNYEQNKFAEIIPSPHFIESFEESFNFSRSEENYSYSRSVSLKYKQDAGDQFLAKAKKFLRDIYSGFRPNLGNHNDGISENGRFDEGLRGKTTETIDLVNLSVALDENLETSLIVGNYSKRQSYSNELGSDGFLKKTYEIEIQALNEPLEQVAEEACKEIVNAILAENLAGFHNPLSITKTIERDGGKINLSIDFSNNPALNREETLTYTITRDFDCPFSQYTISVSISASGVDKEARGTKAKAFWASQKDSYINKINSPITIYERSRSTTFDLKSGDVGDTVVYTEDPSYETNIGDDILKKVLTISKNEPLKIQSLFIGIGGNEIAHQGDFNDVVSVTHSWDIFAKQSMKVLDLLSYARDLAPNEENTTARAETANLERQGTSVTTFIQTS